MLNITYPDNLTRNLQFARQQHPGVIANSRLLDRVLGAIYAISCTEQAEEAKPLLDRHFALLEKRRPKISTPIGRGLLRDIEGWGGAMRKLNKATPVGTEVALFITHFSNKPTSEGTTLAFLSSKNAFTLVDHPTINKAFQEVKDHSAMAALATLMVAVLCEQDQTDLRTKAIAALEQAVRTSAKVDCG